MLRIVKTLNCHHAAQLAMDSLASVVFQAVTKIPAPPDSAYAVPGAPAKKTPVPALPSTRPATATNTMECDNAFLTHSGSFFTALNQHEYAARQYKIAH